TWLACSSRGRWCQMSKLQRVREVPSAPLTPDYVSQKAKEGWKLTAVEWEREVEEPATQPGPLTEEVPYGLRVSADCSHLEENATEKRSEEHTSELQSLT